MKLFHNETFIETTEFEIAERSLNGKTCLLAWMQPAFPVDSIREATFTVLPQMSK